MGKNWVKELIRNTDSVEEAAKYYANWHWGNFPEEMLIKDFITAAKWQKKSTYKNKKLYSKIEHLIIAWNIDGTKTAGSLTRDIMKLLKKIK
jgi:hypothetical protein